MGLISKEKLKALFAQNKAIQERKRQRIKEQQKKYREQNRELIKQKAKIYRERNREFIRKYDEAWRKKLPLPTHTEYPPPPPPPFKTKKEVEEMYAKWLKELQEREPLIKGKALMFNILMQESLKNSMGRCKLTNEQIEKKYQDYKELLQELIEKRKNMALDDPNRESLTRKISATNGRLIYYKKNYSTVIPEEKKNKSKVREIKSEINKNSEQKFKEFEQKALSRIAIAKQQGNEAEVKILQERLDIVRLRVKYSFC